MDLKLSGKSALVCASSAGIGKAIALGLAREGARVALLARDLERLEMAAREIRAVSKAEVITLPCDLANAESIRQAFGSFEKAFGPPNILIHNQGGPPPGGLESVTDEQLNLALETNLKAVFLLNRLAVPSMKARGWGRIVSVLSISAKESLPNMLLSNVLRPAVQGMSKALAVELAPFGITVNTVLPAAVLTKRSLDLMAARAERENKSQDLVRLESAKSIPLGRQASPEEFAETVLFLCGEGASYVTGAAIPIDGAFSKAIF
jgi:3-oxoacyl-[acyl-carrier protein] reductase